MAGGMTSSSSGGMGIGIDTSSNSQKSKRTDDLHPGPTSNDSSTMKSAYDQQRQRLEQRQRSEVHIPTIPRQQTTEKRYGRFAPTKDGKWICVCDGSHNTFMYQFHNANHKACSYCHMLKPTAQMF